MSTGQLASRRQFALRLWDSTGRLGLHELVVVVVAFLLYFFIRGAVVDRAADALGNAGRLITVEKRLWLYHEHTMQSWLIDHSWAVRLFNQIYFWGHMPLVLVIAVWLWVRHRHNYILARNAFLASGAIGIVIYWAVPVAPPRLMPELGIVDTMAVYDRLGYNAQQTKAFVNPYAALPSLHFGWSLLLAAVAGWVGGTRWHWAFGGVWAVAMFVAVVLTGNHFILDAVAGAAVSFLGLLIALLLDRRWPAVFARIA